MNRYYLTSSGLKTVVSLKRESANSSAFVEILLFRSIAFIMFAWRQLNNTFSRNILFTDKFVILIYKKN